MFRKLVSNVDLYNQLGHVDNKLDIILTKMNEGNVRSCCDCKYNESVVYEQLKCYIEERFTTLQESMSHIDMNIHVLQETFNNCRKDMIGNLEFIICNLNKELSSDKEQLLKLDEIELRVQEALKNITELITNLN